MKLPRLPRLPVSRHRHEALRQVNEYNMAVARQTEGQLRRAQACVAKLEQERDDLIGRIKAFRDARQRGSQTVATEHAERNLYVALGCTCERFVREGFDAHWESCPQAMEPRYLGTREADA